MDIDKTIDNTLILKSFTVDIEMVQRKNIVAAELLPDCVKNLAFRKLLDRKPDLCVSGINPWIQFIYFKRHIFGNHERCHRSAGIEGIPAIGFSPL